MRRCAMVDDVSDGMMMPVPQCSSNAIGGCADVVGRVCWLKFGYGGWLEINSSVAAAARSGSGVGEFEVVVVGG